jgi:GAF domain-containing protein
VPDGPDHNDELTALSASLSAMASAILGEETLAGTLDLVVSLATAALPHAYGTSVTVAGTRRLRTLSATSQAVRDVDNVQYTSGQGPCVEATASGVAQQATGNQLTERWPEFGAAAVEHGIASVLSIPLGVPDRTAGALNLYGAADDTFGQAETRLATVFARHAAAVLANAVSIADAEATNRNLVDALATRQVIGQAMGIIMARERCDSDRAFDVLRRASQRTNRKLREIAEEIVTSVESGPPRVTGDD